jgi:hypothetical protein
MAEKEGLSNLLEKSSNYWSAFTITYKKRLHHPNFCWILVLLTAGMHIALSLRPMY